MKLKTLLIIFLTTTVLFIIFLIMFYKKGPTQMIQNESLIKLPEPKLISQISIEQAINQRKSIREYKNEPITLVEVGQLLWSAQGLNSSSSRTAPSAGALYPIEIYLVVKDVVGLDKVVYHYLVENHSLEKYLDQQLNKELASAAYNQEWVERAPVKIIISGIFTRTTKKYGERGIQYVFQESGHVAQNVYLQAESLGLGTVSVGGFDQEKVDRLFDFNENQQVLYIMPVGKK